MSYSTVNSMPTRPTRLAAALALTLSTGVLSALLVSPSTHAQAAPSCSEANQNGCVELSPTPVNATTAVPPNLIVILDDSGSMSGASIYGPNGGDYNDPAENKLYYDPSKVYTPPPKADGSYYPSYDDMESVPSDGFRSPGSTTNIADGNGTKFLMGSTWYQVVEDISDCDYAASQCATPDHTASSASDPFVPDATNLAGNQLTVGENMANWYAYYRTRMLTAKTGLMIALANFPVDYRFGFGSINDNNTGELPDADSSSYISLAKVQPYGDGTSGTQKAAFWDWLETIHAQSGTPLRRALESAGKYYETDHPWTTMAGDPNYGTDDSDEKLSCRASYTILMTDGYWNGWSPGTTPVGSASANGNIIPSPDGTGEIRYEAVPPFSGGPVNNGRPSLADVAAYYWKRDLAGMSNRVPAGRADPAYWQHMTTFTVSFGVYPSQVQPFTGSISESDIDSIFTWANAGGGDTNANAIPGFAWPTVANGTDDGRKIADLVHAGVTGHGDFFSAASPQELADAFASAIAQISKRNVAAQPSAANASVAVTGALTFSTSYNTTDWAGNLKAVELKRDGSTGDMIWDVTAQLDALDYTDRDVFTAVYSGVDCADPATSSPTFNKGIKFLASNAASLDCAQTLGLQTPALAGGSDTLQNRMRYILGDDNFEAGSGSGIYRQRAHKLGAIIRSQPVYVSYPAAGYYNIWPAGSPEANAVDSGNGYGQFILDHKDRPGTIYVGANDGMLHAFAAPAPNCDYSDPTNVTCTFGSGGQERWAFVPRAVYANLGNLTDNDFSFRPTVDAIPRTRDVFFNNDWHSILVGGVGLGGRGVYALDITDPVNFNETDVLWEFDSDMEISGSCVASHGSCRASDLGYTMSSPNIARLATGKWVVLVPNGYFPDCSRSDVPTGEAETSGKPACKAIAAQAPTTSTDVPYSALFVLDAESGQVIAELKTPVNISGVSSYGLGSVVMGDYTTDFIDDVAFAGDLMGNLWRFDLTDPNPANWKVELAFKGKVVGGKQGAQPITVQPRLFPDGFSNRFMVVFGTGKYLGVDDNSSSIPVQSVYGIRELEDSSGNLITIPRSQLLAQDLTETAGTGDLAGATLRQLTDNQLGAGQNGWYFDLDLPDAEGERVVVTPAALFATNTAVLQTLIPSTENYCSALLDGAVMVLESQNGGAGSGVSSLGGYVGARVNNVATSGTVPVVSRLGGGEQYVPVDIDGGSGGGSGGGGTGVNGGGVTLDGPLWRRRSWSILETK